MYSGAKKPTQPTVGMPNPNDILFKINNNKTDYLIAMPCINYRKVTISIIIPYFF